MEHPSIENALTECSAVFDSMKTSSELRRSVNKAIEMVTSCLQAGNKLMFAGNGGSAADAQHMSAEYVSRFMFDRPGLPSVALTTDTSALTAIGNDYGFDQLFSRQIQALGNNNDILFCYSTSGSSPNILSALNEAKSRGISAIGLTGKQESAEQMISLCDISLVVPSRSTPRIQEGHLLLGHVICGAVEETLFGANR